MAELVSLGAQLDQLSLRVEQLGTLSEGLNRRLISTVDETSGLIATLCGHHDEVRHIYQLPAARHSLKTAVQKAQRFMDQVYEITFHCSAESELLLSARTGVNSEWNLWIMKIYRPNLGPLSDLIKQLTYIVSKAELFYLEFEEACDAVITTCSEAAEVCKHTAKKTRVKKEAAKMVGGVTAFASVAAGILAPGVAPLATGVAVGAGAAAFTVYLVRELEESAATFRNIGTQFDSLLDTSYGIKEEVNTVYTGLVSISGLLDSLVLHSNNHQSIVSVRESLERLNEVGSRIQTTVSSCSRSLQTKADEL